MYSQSRHDIRPFKIGDNELEVVYSVFHLLVDYIFFLRSRIKNLNLIRIVYLCVRRWDILQLFKCDLL